LRDSEVSLLFGQFTALVLFYGGYYVLFVFGDVSPVSLSSLIRSSTTPRNSVLTIVTIVTATSSVLSPDPNCQKGYTATAVSSEQLSGSLPHTDQ